jgi:hypothetical protein
LQRSTALDGFQTTRQASVSQSGRAILRCLQQLFH